MHVLRKDNSNTLVAFIISEQFWPEYTGWIKQTLTMATEVADIHFHVVCRKNTRGDIRDLPKNITINHLPPHRLKRGLWNQFVFITFTLTYLWRRRTRVDLLYFPYTFFPAFIFMGAGRILRIPVVARISGQELVFNTSMAARFRLAALRRATTLIVLNQKDKERLKNLGVEEKNIHWIPNGVDINRFTSKKISEKHNAQIISSIPFVPSDRIVITFAGIICHRKGVIELLEAFENMYAILETIPFLILAGPYEGVGEVEPNYLARVRQRVEALHPNVIMTGHISDMPALFKASDIFVLPSLAEGMPNALLEAMATGLPCIATSIPGVIEVIIDGENGLLVTPGTSCELSEALISLIENSERRRELGRSAQKTIENQFSISHTAKQYKFVFYQAMANTHRPHQ